MSPFTLEAALCERATAIRARQDVASLNRAAKLGLQASETPVSGDMLAVIKSGKRTWQYKRRRAAIRGEGWRL